MQVSMWLQLQVPKIEDGNNFGVAVQVCGSSSHPPLRSPVSLISLPDFAPSSPGESVWAADQHAHQDRGLPDPDHKVRVGNMCVTEMPV